VAVLVLEALGKGGAIPSAAVDATFAPRAKRHAVYVAAMARQRELYDRLADWPYGKAE
jgi:hypothetical protein